MARLSPVQRKAVNRAKIKKFGALAHKKGVPTNPQGIPAKTQRPSAPGGIASSVPKKTSAPARKGPDSSRSGTSKPKGSVTTQHTPGRMLPNKKK